MYTAFLFAHSWLRWVVLILALAASARALSGRMNRAAWQPTDDAVGRWFVISLDVQVLVGLTLSFVLSPVATVAWRNLGEVMRNAPIRFITVEHLVGMLAATALAHVGRVRIRKTTDARRRHTSALIFYGLALLLMLSFIPWPFRSAGAPLLRLL